MKDDLRKPWYIGGRGYDLLLIVGAPLLSVLIVGSILPNRAESQSWIWPSHGHWLAFWALVLTFLHVNIGFARSHFNTRVFPLHKIRFLLVPVLVALALSLSSTLLAVAAFVALIWDELHSAFQTFGFGRLYDSKLGNDPNVGRRLDRGMCVVLEWLPHLAFLSYMSRGELSAALTYHEFPADLIDGAAAAGGALRYPIVIGSAAYLGYYIYRYVGFVRAGYRIAPAKIGLYLATFSAVLYAIATQTLVGIVILTNLYHAIQYIAIVWLTERKNLRERLGVGALRGGLVLTLLILIAVSGSLAFARARGFGLPWLAGAYTTLSLMHYWYDSFIWSVRRAQVETA